MVKKSTLPVLSIILCYQFCFGMNDDSAQSRLPKTPARSPIIQDIEILRPYYQAIKQIRVTLDAVAQKYQWPTRFADWRPNPRGGRTPRNMFVRTSCQENGSEEQLVGLYTPFGRFELFSVDHFLDELLAASKDFLAAMKWELEDVSDRLNYYSYDQPENVKQRLYFGNEGCKTYLVKSVNGKDFSQQGADEHVILVAVWLERGQYEKEQQLLHELSEGTDQF